MPKQRKNALAQMPAPRGDSQNVRIREIANGYLIVKEGVKRGKYFQTERFSPTRPTVRASAGKPGAAPGTKSQSQRQP